MNQATTSRTKEPPTTSLVQQVKHSNDVDLDTDADSGTYLPDVMELTYIDIATTKKGVFNSSVTLLQCQSDCASTPGCVAYAIKCSDGPNCGGSTIYSDCGGKPHLGASSIVPNNQSVTLVKLNGSYAPIVGVDFSGNDITSFNGAIQDCFSACDSTPSCGMITIIANSYPINGSSVSLCYLKTNTNIDWKFNDGYQSYVIPKTTTSGIHSMFTCIPCPAGETFYNTGTVILLTLHRLLLASGLIGMLCLPIRCNQFMIGEAYILIYSRDFPHCRVFRKHCSNGDAYYTAFKCSYLESLPFPYGSSFE